MLTLCGLDYPAGDPEVGWVRLEYLKLKGNLHDQI